MKLSMITIKNSRHNGGFAALLTVLVVSAAVLIISYSASMLGLGELDMGYTAQRGEEAFYVADGCAEEVLGRMRKDANYGVGAGTVNLTVSNGSCTMNITDLGSNQRLVVVAGTVDSYTKKIIATTTVNVSAHSVLLDGWEESDQ